MTKFELKQGFEKTANDFSIAVQDCLKTSSCDEETKIALNEIARQMFYTIHETQELIVKYLDK